MELKIITFNIRCCDDVNGHSIPERAERLFKILERENADIIGFQEYTDKWEEAALKILSEKYTFYNVWRDDAWHESSPVLYKTDRFDEIEKEAFWLSDTPEKMSKGWDELFDCPRICERVLLKEKSCGKTIQYLNTHYGFGDDCQQKSGRLITKYSEKLNAPTFLTGDFNMEPNTPGYKTILENFTDAGVDFNEPTFHNYYNDFENKKQHIDYGFYKNGVKILSKKVLNDSFDGKYPSDHFGLCFTVEI